MSSWNTVRLGDLCANITSGGTPLRSIREYYEGGTIPWLKTGEVKKSYVWEVEEFITERGLKESSAKLIPSNSLIVAMYGDGNTAGNVAINKIPLATNQACCNFTLNPKLADYRYVYHYLKASYNNLVGLKLGGSQQNLNAATLKAFPINVPPLETQQKIAAILSAYDDLIANNRRRITLLERMAEDIYREWFVRLRFPGYAQVTLEKGVPKGWRFAELGSVCTLIKRGIAPNYSETSASLVINQRCIRDGSVDLVEARHHDTKVPTEKFVRHGDVLINSTGVGTLGRVAVFDHEATSATCDTHVTICRTKPEAASAYFLGHCLMSLQGHFESMAVGSTGQSELGREAISRTAILVPPLGTQMTFAGAVAPLWRSKRLLQRQNTALATTRDALLPRLISGKLAVDALDIRFPPDMAPPEPESVGKNVRKMAGKTP